MFAETTANCEGLESTKNSTFIFFTTQRVLLFQLLNSTLLDLNSTLLILMLF